MPVRTVLALGANLGEREETLIRAIADICSHEKIRLDKVSPVAVTRPVGGPAGQPEYYNLVLEAETDLSPFDLLRFCQEVEAKHHRTREVRWGARTLDIDIIKYGELEMDEPELTIPHPRANERAFVLEPWARMNPEAELAGESVAQLAQLAEDLDGIREFREAPIATCA